MSNQDWPDELDALTAAPQFHALLFENELVRVLDTRVPPGHTVPLHTHRWPSALYIRSWSDFIRRDANGQTVIDSRTITKIPVKRAPYGPDPCRRILWRTSAPQTCGQSALS